jgi:hypothetical protein
VEFRSSGDAYYQEQCLFDMACVTAQLTYTSRRRPGTIRGCFWVLRRYPRSPRICQMNTALGSN